MKGTGLTRWATIAFLLGPSLWAQERSVTVVHPQDHELRRTAYRLRICPQDLKNARALLEEATRLVPEVAGNSSIGLLGHMWTRLHRSEAERALQPLVLELRSTAARTNDADEYRRTTEAANQLIGALETVNPLLADQLSADWPDPPEEDPPAAGGWIRSGPRSARMYRLVHADPDRALELLLDAETSDVHHWYRVQLASTLRDSGRTEAARDLLDRTLSTLFSSPPSAETLDRYVEVASAMIHSFPERLDDVIDRFGDAVREMTGRGLPTREFPIGQGKTIEVTPEESALLSFLDPLGRMRPETAVQILNSFPDLRVKLDEIGGLDGFISRHQSAPRSPGARVQTLVWQLEGEAPDRVRGRLSALEADDNPHLLIMTAERLCHSDGEKGLTAFDVASKRVSEVDDSIQAGQFFERLMQASLLCQGEVDADTLIRASALLAKLWRDVDEGDDPSEAQRLVEVADRLEISLIVSTGIVDFASTMRRIRDLPDQDRKFLAMTRLIGLLARQGGYIG